MTNRPLPAIARTVLVRRCRAPGADLGVVLGLEFAATAGLIWWAGWDKILHALSLSNTAWFGLCAAGQLIAYLGYGLALRATAGVDNGVELSLPTSLAVVSVGFGPMFSANTSGGFSVDYLTLRHAGMSKKRSTRRVLGLSALEYAVLAPAVALCGVLLFLGVGGSAPGSVALPWLAVIPGAAVAAWLTSPKHKGSVRGIGGRRLPQARLRPRRRRPHGSPIPLRGLASPWHRLRRGGPLLVR